MRHLLRSFATCLWLTLLVCPACPEDSGDDDTTSGDDDTTSDDDDSSAPVDADGDGFAEDVDCDDDDPATYPGADELCDGVDNDCNGLVDDDPGDADGDGYDDCVDPTPAGFDGATGREAPLSMQLHLHGSLSEFDGTMACHTEQAEAYGVDVLWWTDHDNMIQMIQCTGGYDFDAGTMTDEMEIVGTSFVHGVDPVEVTLSPGLSEIAEGGPSGAGYYWRFGGTDVLGDGNWSYAQYVYHAEDATSHHATLLADTSATIWLLLDQALTEDWQLLFTVDLSSTCAGDINQITYFVATEDLTTYTSDTHLYVALPTPATAVWTELSLPLTADSAHFAEADDQAATDYTLQLRARNGSQASIGFDDFLLSWQREGEDLRQYQRTVLDERYSDGSVTHFVGQEITLVTDGKHMNPFGAEQVPLIDYLVTGALTSWEITEHIHAAGGIAMCNHPFGAKIGLEFEGEEADEQVEQLTKLWLNGEAFGCDLVEVGYRARRVDLEHHLMFWDNISGAGYHVTGTGTNDHHWTTDWIEHANPFLTWVFQDTPTREGIADQLTQGRAFFGDPGPFLGQEAALDLWTEHGAVMGQVLVSDLDQVLHVHTGYLEGGWSLELVVDGEVFESILLAGDETDTVFELPRGDVRTVRAQIADEEGELILLSNPLYLVMPGEEVEAGSQRVVIEPR